MTKQICASRGPRIGDDGVPYCKLVVGHVGNHRAHPEDGWRSNDRWGEPLMFDLAVRREYSAAGIDPYVPE